MATEKELQKEYHEIIKGNLKLWEGEFTPDPRYEALLAKLDWYYKCTPDEMNNRDALPYSRALSKWRKERGYSIEEFNRAKRDYFNMKHSPDVRKEEVKP